MRMRTMLRLQCNIRILSVNAIRSMVIKLKSLVHEGQFYGFSRTNIAYSVVNGRTRTKFVRNITF